jgi:hypothetical protein
MVQPVSSEARRRRMSGVLPIVSMKPLSAGTRFTTTLMSSFSAARPCRPLA